MGVLSRLAAALLCVFASAEALAQAPERVTESATESVSGSASGRALDGNPAALIRLYPRGDHALFESEHGYGRDIPGVSRFAPGFLTDLDAFIGRYAVQP